jgi:hypothetical protein
MDRLPRILAFASLAAIALALAGCGFDTSKVDPTDLLDNIFSDQKKPLQGERKPLFPEGTPGVQRGVPPDLVKGYQPPPEPPPPEDQPPAPKSKAKAKAQATGPAGAGAPYAN